MEQDQRRQKWEQHVAAWRDSGMSQHAYARAHGGACSSLAYWCRKLRPDPRAEGQVSVPAQVLTSEAALSLLGPGGWTLQLPPSVPASWVAALLRSLA